MSVDRLKSLAKRYESGLRIGKASTLPSVRVLRCSNSDVFEAHVFEPMVCLILQGEAEFLAGDQAIKLAAGEALLVSHDMPVSSKTAAAREGASFLALVLRIDLGLIRSFYDQVGDVVPPKSDAFSLTKGAVACEWATSIERYLSMMDGPLEAQVLGPAVLREIHFHLLMSQMGGMLRQLLSLESHASRIAKTVSKLHENFDAPLAIADLASLADMSQSSFHAHFKSVIGTTPRRYQKELRMVKARALLRGTRISVSDVSKAVGYESPTHFSRDYTRKFGLPPSREAKIA